ncbi:MAG TPA: hypothetical protein VMR21_01865 [Vicinamibacteria bacterium]|nr:hypothetical protein [Vicinamibacteria bacterium]
MTRFRLATRTQMIVMTVVWLGVLIAIDYTKNPHLRAAAAPERPPTAALSLWVNHLCCTGCLSDVRDALAALPWVDAEQIRARKAVVSREHAEMQGAQSDYGGWVDVGVSDVAGVDFVAIDHALRERGLVASRMEFAGPPHYRLEAKVGHLCCGLCREAAQGLTTLERARARLRWVDSVTADRAAHTVTVHARYQGPGEAVDVADLLGAFDEAGLPPFSLRVLADAEPATVPAGAGGR